MTPRDLAQSPGWRVVPWIKRCNVMVVGAGDSSCVNRGCMQLST